MNLLFQIVGMGAAVGLFFGTYFIVLMSLTTKKKLPASDTLFILSVTGLLGWIGVCAVLAALAEFFTRNNKNNKDDDDDWRRRNASDILPPPLGGGGDDLPKKEDENKTNISAHNLAFSEVFCMPKYLNTLLKPWF